MSSGFSEKQDLLVLLSVAGSQNVPQVDLILYLPSTYPDILENGEKKSPSSNMFGYKWTGLKLGKDNNNLLYMIEIKRKSLFNTH